MEGTGGGGLVSTMRTAFLALLLAAFWLPEAHAGCSDEMGAEAPGEPRAQRAAKPFKENIKKPNSSYEYNFDGAAAARKVGRAWVRYQLLDRAVAIEAKPEAVQAIELMQGRYGRVNLVGDYRWRPKLCRAALPFAPDEVAAIQWAMYVARNTGFFDGMLPVGEYTYGDRSFTLEAGVEVVEIKIDKPKKVVKAGN